MLKNRETIYRYTFYALLMLASVFFVYLLRGLFLTFILTLVLVYLLHPLVYLMESRGAPRVVAILLAYTGILIVVAAVLMYGIPRLVSQLHLLVDMLPVYTAQVEFLVGDIQDSYYRTELPEGMRHAINEQISQMEFQLQGILEDAVQAILNLVRYTFNIILAPVLAFYILKDLDNIKEEIANWLPEHKFSYLWQLGRQVNTVLTSFIRGHLILMLLVGLMSAVAMALLGVEYSVMLGIVAGIAELIPYFGPLIGAVPAVGIALLHSKWLVLKVILAILIVQQLEGNVVAPKVLGESVGLNPLIIILVLVAGAKLSGVTGMLLAVPLAAIIKILIAFAYKQIILQPD
ncbi:MAG: AI-2E family transporter [Firmicutes bacterium]|nr:AI-2E family transporter [Bacillota bacterium]